MMMDELRRLVKTTNWPAILRAQGKYLWVGSPEELMVPSDGNLVCVYEQGAFEVIDCARIASLCGVKLARRQH